MRIPVVFLAGFAVVGVVTVVHGLWWLALPAVLAVAVLTHVLFRQSDGARFLSRTEQLAFVGLVLTALVVAVLVRK